MEIEYIQGEKNIVADELSRLPTNGNQNTTYESIYTTETMSELYDIDELPEGTFPISFNTIYRYQQGDPIISKQNLQNIKRFIFAEAGIL